MPNQTDPNQNSQPSILPVSTPVQTDQPTGTTPPPIPTQTADLPPLPDFMTTDSSSQDLSTSPVNIGSADPPKETPNQAEQIVPMVASPKKKFGGGKIIATILGLFLLIGGVGAGILLIGQNQDVNEQAAGLGEVCDRDADCIGTNLVCHCQNGNICDTGICVDKTDLNGNSEANCLSQNRSWCKNFNHNQRWTCCEPGYSCGASQIGCYCQNGNCGSPPPSPSNEPLPACVTAIVLYTQQGAMITDLSAIKSGQKVFLTIPTAYGANNTLHFSKARFTVNGTLRPETSNKRVFQVAEVFYDEYTVTSGATSVQAEVEYGGIWYGK